MNATELSSVLAPAPEHEPYVRRRFSQKLRKTLGHVPFAAQAVAAYYAAVDPETPRYAKATLMAALAYFILPSDMIPDILAVIGFTDDAAVLMMAVRMLSQHIKPEHVQRAHAVLAEQA